MIEQMSNNTMKSRVYIRKPYTILPNGNIKLRNPVKLFSVFSHMKPEDIGKYFEGARIKFPLVIQPPFYTCLVDAIDDYGVIFHTVRQKGWTIKWRGFLGE